MLNKNGYKFITETSFTKWNGFLLAKFKLQLFKYILNKNN